MNGWWNRARGMALALVAVVGAPGIALAGHDDCDGDRPAISFVSFPTPNLDPVTAPAKPVLTLKGKLSIPRGCRGKLPAVVIVHGSSGVVGLGDFYEQSLLDAGIATLQIDMWEARGIANPADRPKAPIITFPDAFSALGFLSTHPRIAANRIGILGYSWGAVTSLGTAEKLYAGLFGGGRQFKAHVANYPPCYGANNTSIPVLNPPSQVGTQFLNLTGAPVMIQIGSEDDYDNGTAHCRKLAQTVNPLNNNAVEVVAIPGAYHGFDRLSVPTVVADPFANEGSFFTTGQVPLVSFVPDVEKAYDSRERVTRFFKRRL